MAQKRKATKRQESPGQIRDKKNVAGRVLPSVPQTKGKNRVLASTSQNSSKQKRKKPLVVRLFVGIIFAGLMGFLAIVILSLTPLFTIEQVDYIPSAHVTSDDLKNLVSIPQGTTLLSVNPFVINSEARRNPWVESVALKRIYPSTLQVSIKEKDVLALVEAASSETAWYLGVDQRWIEPASLPTGSNTDTSQAILNEAISEHTLLIKDVPDTLTPKAGAQVSDPEILGALKFQSGFSAALRDQIAVYSAPNENTYTLTLSNGVTVALGDTSDIPSKEAVILKLLETYPSQLTYINVKTPAKPTFRKIDGASTSQGTGLAGK